MNNKPPQHIAIVMDGNGRWAQSRDLPRIEGHREGAKTVKRVIRDCLEEEVPVLSLFAFSSENWSRPVSEVDFLMQLFLEALNNEVTELHQHGVRLRFSGDRSGLSLLLQQQMQHAESLTLNNQRLILNVVVNYGGKWDILHATQEIAKRVLTKELAIEAIDESVFSKFLNASDLPDPDLLIRTSGEKRISNFFLWQLAYTELYFTDVYWPDFDGEEFKKALADFKARQRRYGRVSSQQEQVYV